MAPPLAVSKRLQKILARDLHLPALGVPLAVACGPGPPQQVLLMGAACGILDGFKRIAATLDGGKGRIREAVEAIRDDNGDGVLHFTAANGRTEVCTYLVEELHMDVNAAAESGTTPLSYAVRSKNNVAAVRYLLDRGADPDKPVEDGCTSLHIAVGKGLCVMIDLLLSKGADVNCFSYCGTPLHVAAMENQVAAMKILLDYNADCNKEFGTIFTPLFTALCARSLNCVKLLIKAGADVNKGVHKITPLILVANKGLAEFYECLLEAGADPNVPDECGQLPIEIAAFKNRWKDVEILLRVTSRIPSVHDWSVDGVLAYVKSTPTDLDDPMYKMNLADLKLEGSKAFEREDYYSAVKFYTVNYGKACDAFLDGLKLDPGNAELENALRETLNSLKISRATAELSELSIDQKNVMHD